MKLDKMGDTVKVNEAPHVVMFYTFKVGYVFFELCLVRCERCNGEGGLYIDCLTGKVSHFASCRPFATT